MYRKYINIVEAANKGCPIATYDIDANGVVSVTVQGGGPIRVDTDTVYQVGRGSLGTVSDTLTLAIAARNANKNAVATITWIEQR